MIKPLQIDEQEYHQTNSKLFSPETRRLIEQEDSLLFFDFHISGHPLFYKAAYKLMKNKKTRYALLAQEKWLKTSVMSGILGMNNEE